MVPGTTDPEVQYSLDARLDRVPATGRHILWISLLGAAYFIEIFDNVSFSFVAPAVRAEFSLTIGEVGLIVSAVFVGALFGAFVGGLLSDRMGRRPVLVASCLVFSFGSIFSAVAPSWEILALSRLITGFGMQAAVGVLLVIVSEMFPRVSRGRYFTVLTCIGFACNPVTAFIAMTIVPLGTSAWRWVFVIGGSGIIIAILVALLMPETVRWQVMHGKREAAARMVVTLETAAERKGKVLPQPEITMPIIAGAPRPTMRDLVRGEGLQRLAVISIAFFAYVFCLYGFVAWIPTILTDGGMTQHDALQFATILSLGMILGPIILYPFADKVERKTVIFVGSIITAGGLTVFALVEDPTVSLIAAFVAQLAATNMTTSFYTYIPEVFPTALRGIGVGTVNGLGRFAGVLSGVTVAAVYTAWGFQVLYLMLAVIFVFTGILLMVFGIRTTNRSLEAISEAEIAEKKFTESTNTDAHSNS